MRKIYCSHTGFTNKTLISASRGGEANVVHSCLSSSCDVNYRDENNGWTALMYARRGGHEGIVKLLEFYHEIAHLPQPDLK